MKLEICSTLGLTAGGIFFDMYNMFDSLKPLVILEKTWGLGFSPLGRSLVVDNPPCAADVAGRPASLQTNLPKDLNTGWVPQIRSFDPSSGVRHA